MTAEQAKAESTQRGLEEERRALSMQITVEREELERAKVRLMNVQVLHLDSTPTPHPPPPLLTSPACVPIRAHYWRSRSQ